MCTPRAVVGIGGIAVLVLVLAAATTQDRPAAAHQGTPEIQVSPLSVTITEPALIVPRPPATAIGPREGPLGEHVPGRLMVRLAEGLAFDPVSRLSGLAELDALAAEYGLQDVQPIPPPPGVRPEDRPIPWFNRVYRLDFAGSPDVRELMNAFGGLPGVEIAEPEPVLRVPGLMAAGVSGAADRRALGAGSLRAGHVPPNDPLYPLQWGLNNTGQAIPFGGGDPVGTPGADVNAEAAWDLATGGHQVVVAMLDSGIDHTHPEFADRIIHVAGEPDQFDHGIATAGIIAARGNNALGVAGIAWDVLIMSWNVFDIKINVFEAIEEAILDGADVMYIGFTITSANETWENAIAVLEAVGMPVVAPTGNSDSSAPFYPAAFETVISVGALSPCDERKSPASCDGAPWGSSFGAGMDLLAPGVQIHSTTMGGGYVDDFWGSSAAAAHVAGIVALMKSLRSDLSPARIREILRSTAVDLGEPGYDDETGFGRVDAAAALQAVAELGHFTVTNVGGSVLDVTAISSSEAWLSIDAVVPFALEPGESRHVALVVDWDVVSDAESATVTVTSNDPATPTVNVDVTAVPTTHPPIAQYTPPLAEGIEASVPAGESAEESLTITNLGDLNLEFEFPAFSGRQDRGTSPFVTGVTPVSGVLGPGMSAELTVALSAVNLSPGTHTGGIEVVTNEEGEGSYTYPVTLHVTGLDCPLTWETDLVATSVTEVTSELTFGQGPTATDGLDPQCGEVELPPPPPGFEARFLLPGDTTGSYADFRGVAATELEWRISLSGSPEDFPIAFSWDPESLPEGRTFLLRDVATGGDLVDIDMTVVGSFNHVHDGVTSLAIVERVIAVVDFAAGWNMLSVPVETEEMAATALFPDAASSFFTFDDGYVEVETLQTAVGYWARFDEPGVAEIVGQAAEAQVVPVAAGWNMIGFFEAEVPVSEIVSDPPGIVESAFFGYDGSYHVAETLEPGGGYWVKAADAGELFVAPSRLGDPLPAPEYIAALDGATWLDLTDDLDRTARLYLLTEPGAGQGLLLPPPPPEGAFDVRFDGGLAGVVLSEGPWGLTLSGASYPVRIELGELDGRLHLTDRVDGSLFDVELEAGGEILLDLPLSGLYVSHVPDDDGPGLPTSFALEAAFPNPSLDGVTIGYALPEAAHVRLQVYDLLGRVVARVVDEEMPPGRHAAVVAAGLASGTYVYRIEAGSFTATRRFTIAR